MVAMVVMVATVAMVSTEYMETTDIIHTTGMRMGCSTTTARMEHMVCMAFMLSTVLAMIRTFFSTTTKAIS